MRGPEESGLGVVGAARRGVRLIHGEQGSTWLGDTAGRLEVLVMRESKPRPLAPDHVQVGAWRAVWSTESSERWGPWRPPCNSPLFSAGYCWAKNGVSRARPPEALGKHTSSPLQASGGSRRPGPVASSLESLPLWPQVLLPVCVTPPSAWLMRTLVVAWRPLLGC